MSGFGGERTTRRVEVACILLVVLLAAVPRLWAFGDVGLSHFDEGGYALSSLALRDGKGIGSYYPLQHFLSPPAYFTLSGVAMSVFGATDRAPLGVAVAFAILTVLLVYLVGRSWFGRSAGLAAAAILALSDYHVLFSRSGLTDLTFTFFFLLALGLYALAEERRSFKFAVLAGIATGLAWNTKYHGWLAGVVAGAGLGPWLLLTDRRRLPGCVARLFCAAAVACLLYLPWYLYVDSMEGGYARLAEEHLGYLQPKRFVAAIMEHIRMQRNLTGWAGRAAPAVAVAIAFLASGRRSVARGLVAAGLGVFAFLAASVAGGAVVVGLLAIVGAAALLPRLTPARAIALAFFLVFSIMSPLYAPYARLLLPWFIAACLLSGFAIATLLDGEIGRVRRIATAGLAATAVVVAAWQGIDAGANTWRPSDGLRTGCEALAERVDDGRPVLVLGEPAAVFYLKASGVSSAEQLPGPDEIEKLIGPGESCYVVEGIYSRRTRRFARWLSEGPASAEELARVPVRVNDVRLLDDFLSRARKYARGPQTEHDLVLHRVTLR